MYEIYDYFSLDLNNSSKTVNGWAPSILVIVLSGAMTKKSGVPVRPRPLASDRLPWTVEMYFDWAMHWLNWVSFNPTSLANFKRLADDAHPVFSPFQLLYKVS